MEKFTATVQINGSAIVKHNLGTKDVFITTYDTDGYEITMQMKRINVNEIELGSNTPCEVRVVIAG